MYEYEEGYNVRGSHMAGSGQRPFGEFTGERIGHIVVDPMTKALKIVPFAETWPLDPQQPLTPQTPKQ